MPRSFSSANSSSRPDPRLFAVHHLPEKDKCAPDEMQPEVGNIDHLASWVDGLLDNYGPDQVSTPLTNEAWLPPASILDQSTTWGLADPTKPIAGAKPACVLSGRGAVVEQGIAVKPGAAAAEEESEDAEMEFSWVEIDHPMITEDAHGASIEQIQLPAPGGSNDFTAWMHFNPPFLLWAAQRKWLWHRKWMLPAVRVDVRCRNVPRNRRLYVMITAGTLREDSPMLHDQGLIGECQRRLELDSTGHGTAHFSHLLFKYTSFNVGQRPFRIVVTILADQPGESSGAHQQVAKTSIPVAAPGGGAWPAVGGASDDSMTVDVEAGSLTAGAQAVEIPGRAEGSQASGQTRVPLLCMRSDKVHVDARKRSQRERAAAKDDVRLVQRHHAAQNNSAQKAKLEHDARGGVTAGARGGVNQHGINQRLLQQAAAAGASSDIGRPGNPLAGWLGRLLASGADLPAGLGPILGMRNGLSLSGVSRSSSMDSLESSVASSAVSSAASRASTRLGAGQIPGPSDAVVELRGSDAVMLNVHSAGAFGYTPFELVGHPIFAIAKPDEREQLMHALQTLQRMDEISRSRLGNAQAAPRSAIRVIHTIVMGIGQSRAMDLVVADSTITVEQNSSGQRTMLMRSRQAAPEAAAAGFCMELG